MEPYLHDLISPCLFHSYKFYCKFCIRHPVFFFMVLSPIYVSVKNTLIRFWWFSTHTDKIMLYVFPILHSVKIMFFNWTILVHVMTVQSLSWLWSVSKSEHAKFCLFYCRWPFWLFSLSGYYTETAGRNNVKCISSGNCTSFSKVYAYEWKCWITVSTYV